MYHTVSPPINPNEPGESLIFYCINRSNEFKNKLGNWVDGLFALPCRLFLITALCSGSDIMHRVPVCTAELIKSYGIVI